MNFAKEEEVVTLRGGGGTARGRLQRLVKLKGKETNLLPSLLAPPPLIRSLSDCTFPTSGLTSKVREAGSLCSAGAF